MYKLFEISRHKETLVIGVSPEGLHLIAFYNQDLNSKSQIIFKKEELPLADKRVELAESARHAIKAEADFNKGIWIVGVVDYNLSTQTLLYSLSGGFRSRPDTQNQWCDLDLTVAIYKNNSVVQLKDYGWLLRVREAAKIAEIFENYWA